MTISSTSRSCRMTWNDIVICIISDSVDWIFWQFRPIKSLGYYDLQHNAIRCKIRIFFFFSFVHHRKGSCWQHQKIRYIWCETYEITHSVPNSGQIHEFHVSKKVCNFSQTTWLDVICGWIETRRTADTSIAMKNNVSFCADKKLILQ